jgi:SAM-dependent methyltransferase
LPDSVLDPFLLVPNLAPVLGILQKEREMSDSDQEEEETVKYGELQYWEERYGDWAPSPYDWLFEWKHVRHILKEFISKSELVYLPGCGNAPFSAEMYEDGWENMVNGDTSNEAITKMLELHSETCPKAEWLILDATATGYPDGHFNSVIDKSLIDTTVCGQDGVDLTHRFVKETHRVLKVGGYYCTMTLHTWGEIKAYFQSTENFKFASAAIVVNNPDFNSDMPGEEDNPSLKCFAMAKKLQNDASPEEVAMETKQLEDALKAFDDTWMDPAQVAAKEKAVEDELEDESYAAADNDDDEEATDEPATVEELTHCLQRIRKAQVKQA